MENIICLCGNDVTDGGSYHTEIEKNGILVLFRTANENPFTDEITHYGSVKISEEQEYKFQSFFSEYKRFI